MLLLLMLFLLLSLLRVHQQLWLHMLCHAAALLHTCLDVVSRGHGTHASSFSNASACKETCNVRSVTFQLEQ